MPDIMKFIVNDKANLEDPDGNLLVLDEWSARLAANSNIPIAARWRGRLRAGRKLNPEESGFL